MICKAPQYCYDCFEWVVETKWSAHCAADFQALSNLQCGAFLFRGCIVIPGRCPICLGNENLDFSKRMKQWTSQASLLAHVCRHLKNMSLPAECPHPRCSTILHEVYGAGNIWMSIMAYLPTVAVPPSDHRSGPKLRIPPIKPGPRSGLV